MAIEESDGPSYTQPEAIPPRAGESLDIEVVQAYLGPRLPHADGDLTIEQFIGGRANLTYVLRFGAREYVLRRAPRRLRWRLAPMIWRGSIVCCRRCIPSFPLPREPIVFVRMSRSWGCRFLSWTAIRGSSSVRICRRSMWIM